MNNQHEYYSQGLQQMFEAQKAWDDLREGQFSCKGSFFTPGFGMLFFLLPILSSSVSEFPNLR